MSASTSVLSNSKDDEDEITLQRQDNHDHGSDKEEDNDDDANDKYLRMINFQSIRNSSGLEESISISWKGQTKPLVLSTLLAPTDLAPLFDGASWAGTRVWHASICAIEYLEQHYSTYISLLYNRTRKKETLSLLELGCGLGVPGMVAHQLGIANHVCLTDQESIMSQLRKNLQDNFDENHTISVMPLRWSKQGIQELLQQTERSTGFDICLSCDCVYEPLYGKSWKQLVQVMDELLCVNPQTVMLTSVERRAADGIDLFLQELNDAPHVNSVTTVFSDPQYKIEIYKTLGRTLQNGES